MSILAENKVSGIKLNIDIYYNEADITVLRWIADVETVLSPYYKNVVVNKYPINDKHDDKLLILQTEMIYVNNERVEYSDLESEINQKLNNLLVDFKKVTS